MHSIQLLLRSSLVMAVLTGACSLATAAEPIRALLVLGGCCHDYAAQKTHLTEGISQRANVQFTIAYDSDKTTKNLNSVYANADWAKGFDVVVHDECTADVKDIATIDRILAPHRAGTPAVMLHCAMHSYRSEGFPNSTPWFQLTGLASTGHGPQEPIAIRFLDPSHPVTKNSQDWTTIKEELYNNSAGKLLDTAHALASGKQSYKKRDGSDVNAEAVIVWTNTYNSKTRVFATSLGHNNETVNDARYLDLVTRGLLWSVDKLNDEYLKPAATK
jgi:type 1 glutamine amidotransferase